MCEFSARLEFDVSTSHKPDEIGRIRLLLEESKRLRYQNPEEMESLAGLAFAAALRLDPRRYRPVVVADLLARAAAELANARRLRDRLPDAAAGIAQAIAYWQRGSRAPQLLGEIAEYAAAVLCHLRRFPEALEVLDAETRLFEGRGDTRRAGRALVTRAIYTGYANDPRRAIELLCRAMDMLDPRRDAALLLSTGHSIVWFMTDLGWFEAARSYAPLLRRRFEAAASNRLNTLRLEWLEARIHAGRGERARAEELLRRVRRGFSAAGLAFPAALVAVDLANVWFDEGRFEDIEALAGELLATFQALGVPREGIAAMLLVEEAARARQAASVQGALLAASRLLQSLSPAVGQRRITPPGVS